MFIHFFLSFKLVYHCIPYELTTAPIVAFLGTKLVEYDSYHLLFCLLISARNPSLFMPIRVKEETAQFKINLLIPNITYLKRPIRVSAEHAGWIRSVKAAIDRGEIRPT